MKRKISEIRKKEAKRPSYREKECCGGLSDNIIGNRVVGICCNTLVITCIGWLFWMREMEANCFGESGN